jgi:hypothetical protein
MKPELLAASLIASLAVADAAHAEKWTYFPVPGGALAYEADGRKVDLTTGQTEGDVLTYFFVPQALGSNADSLMIQRLDFHCRGDQQFRIIGTAYFDTAGHQVGNTESGNWTALPPTGSPIAVFKRIFCTTDRPPTALDTGDRDALLPLLHALPPTSVRSKAGGVAPPASITLPAAKPKP